MKKDQEGLNKLLDKLDTLVKKQETFAKEVDELRDEIINLKSPDPISAGKKIEPIIADQTEAVKPISSLKESPVQSQPKQPKLKSDLEKFIGENLINKIGIAITVIGVSIGAKYSIENDLISPLTRIILGYLAGIGLLGFGMKLKAKYENYSSVLVSGSLAIMYFITYIAYSFYGLFPQLFAFLLMLIFTAFTVFAALQYNKQVIAHIGLVGAYAVPFLLSEGSGKVGVLFSYMVIINLGILVVSIKKYWKPLYYSSFAFTWLIFSSWYATSYATYVHFSLAFTFLAIFFAIFYTSFISYKLINKENFTKETVGLLLSNSFIFYGLGFSLLSNHETGTHLLGVFTLINAIIHFVVSTIIYKKKLVDKNLLYLISGMVLVFITITVPVQLDGNWVTLLWVGEAALLFWIGRTKNNPIYEKLSYPLMVLAFFSLLQDWGGVVAYNVYDPSQPDTRVTPILNVNFLSTLLFVIAFGFINVINQSKKYTIQTINFKTIQNLISISIPAIFLFTLYSAFFMEISLYWSQLYSDTLLLSSNSDYQIATNGDLLDFKSIWLYNYTLLFFSLITLINIKKIKNALLANVSLVINTLVTISFLFGGLYALSELCDSFTNQTLAEYYDRGLYHIVIRYIALAFFSGFLITGYKIVRQSFIKQDWKKHYDILLHTSIIWVLSSELITWLTMSGSDQSYKLGLSILWGLYALSVIVLGIWKNKKHLRIGAFALFGIALIKLFFYDIAHLETIAKTVVFVSLGILLLIISFLYNKYKHLISNEK